MTKLTQNAKILAFGDSITYGFGTTTTNSYPSKLSTLVSQKIINAGLNGDTTEYGLFRLPKLLKEYDVELILLCFGANDIIQDIPHQTIKANLKKMIFLAKEKNINIILIAVPDVTLSKLAPLKLYQEISQEEDIELIEDLLSEVLTTSSLKSDFVHPNKSGYEYIANKIATYLTTNHSISKTQKI